MLQLVRVVIPVLLAFPISSYSPPIQEKSDVLDKQKAFYCFGFTQHVEWPSSGKEGDFIIGVMGAPNIMKEFERYAAVKKVGDRKVVIKSFNSPKDIGQCQMLYVPTERSGELSAILAKCSGKSILVISDKEGLAKKGGSTINFIFKDNKVTFEYNNSNAGKSGLKIGSYLTSFGKEVTE